MRTIDPEHNWFWLQGYADGLAGQRWDVPDEARTLYQRSDYYAGYGAGSEDREVEPDHEDYGDVSEHLK